MTSKAISDSAALVSVVVPVYNVQAYLEQCVDSILQQTHPKIEVILVDDGSTDRSGDICEAYAAHHNRVRVIHQVNAGLSAARNAGIAISQGSWLLFVDSDDWVHQEIVERLLCIASESGADVAVGGFQRVDDVNGAATLNSDHERIMQFTSAEALAALMGPMHTLLTVAWGKLYQRSLFKDVQYPIGRVHEDEFVSHRLLSAARGVAVLDRPLYFYRQHRESIMGAGFNRAKANDAIAAYADRLGFLRDLGREDLLPLARAQLFRKYVRLFRRIPDGREREEVLSLMCVLAGDMRHHKDKSPYSVFASAYAWKPRLVEPLYRIYERVSHS